MEVLRVIDLEPARGLTRLPDGTVKQVSALTGCVVWTIPGRSHRPFTGHARLPSPSRSPPRNGIAPTAPGE